MWNWKLYQSYVIIFLSLAFYWCTVYSYKETNFMIVSDQDTLQTLVVLDNNIILLLS